MSRAELGQSTRAVSGIGVYIQVLVKGVYIQSLVKGMKPKKKSKTGNATEPRE